MEIVELIEGVMVIDTRMQSFDLKQVKNRRFMYSSKHHTLVLGDPKAGRKIIGSHSQEFHQAKVKGLFDEYIRGWIGRNTSDYKEGIVHFAPQLCVVNLDEGISFLKVLSNAKGFGRHCKVRGFKNVSETSVFKLLPSLFN